MFLRVGCVVGLGLFAAGGAVACPDFNRPATASYAVTGAQLYTATGFDVVAGGEHALTSCRQIALGSDTGNGYFPQAPDFSFQVTGMAAYQLQLRVDSGCDAALLINTASASWYYDDDDNGNLDPMILLTNPADGRVDVWVGTYDGAFCDARLTLETFNK